MAALFKPLFDELERRTAFWRRHYAEFLQLYPDQFVAVDGDGQVVLTSPDLVELLDGLKAAGLDVVKDVNVEYITNKWDSLIL